MMALWLQTATTPVDPVTTINTPIVEYIQVLLVLGGVLALAYAALKFGLPRLFEYRAPADGPIQMVARYPLEPKKSIYLVRVGSQVFLLGTSEGQMEYLTGIEPENATQILESNRRRQELQRKDFRRVLDWVHKPGKVDC
jgi:flagellar biogenesis protein FliO